MAKFILKWRYYKPGAKNKSHRENEVKYIATREGVEKCDESWKFENPTREQERAITKLTQTFPSSLQSQEYQDYTKTPNRYTASQLIDKICFDNKDEISEMENYVQYIGLRPRVEKQGTHGLFSQEDEPINIYDVAREVSEHQGIVWRPILSLTREDAVRLGYEKRDEIFSTYTDKKAERVPLSQNEEFKTIRNAVIREVLNIMQNRDILQEPAVDDLLDEEPDEDEEESEETETSENKWDLYKAAKKHLDSESEDYDPQKALHLLIKSAKLNCSVAKYQLGKLFLSDEHYAKDVDYAVRWLEEASDDGNQYAEYLLGKLYLNGDDIEQDIDEAERLLTRSADQGNKYAAYTLAKEYLSGENFEENIPRALEYLKISADKGFSQAEYLLGKLLYQGELTEKDAQKALEYLERAASQGNHYAAYLAGKILMSEESLKDVKRAVHFFEMAASQGNPYAEFQLGKMYLFGNDIPKDFEKGMEYLKSSAEHGNEFAEKLYNSAHSNRQWSASMGVFRLFHHLARIIQDRLEDERRGKMGATDRKLRRQIDEKKQAQGLKLE